MTAPIYLLYFVLLSILAHVAADNAEDQMMTEAIDRSRPEEAYSAARPHDPALPSDPLPPSLLLKLLRSSDAMLSPPSLPLVTKGYDNDDDDVADNQRNHVSKRVFCNGFTGCGGKHRGRSRRQEKYGKRLIPVLVKRPFCNSFGCYNGKRSSAAGGYLPADSPRARQLARALAAALAAREEELGEAVPPVERVICGPGGCRGQMLQGRVLPLGKRLFCNGYGGCRGGKRSLFSPWMSKMSSVAEGRR